MRDLYFRALLLKVSFLDHQHGLTWGSEKCGNSGSTPGLLNGILTKFPRDLNAPPALLQDIASSEELPVLPRLLLAGAGEASWDRWGRRGRSLRHSTKAWVGRPAALRGVLPPAQAQAGAPTHQRGLQTQPRLYTSQRDPGCGKRGCTQEGWGALGTRPGWLSALSDCRQGPWVVGSGEPRDQAQSRRRAITGLSSPLVPKPRPLLGREGLASPPFLSEAARHAPAEAGSRQGRTEGSSVQRTLTLQCLQN